MRTFLLADIGGTNIRFAWYQNATVSPIATYKCSSFQNIFEAVDCYMKRTGIQPTDIILGAAGNVQNRAVQLTNRSWYISEQILQKHYKLQTCLIVNDFVLQGLGVLQVKDSDKIQLGGGRSQSKEPMVVIGSGTGLGVCFLTAQGNAWRAHSSEAGHITIPTSSKNEQQIVSVLGEKFGLISAERLLAGPGLVNLYMAVCQIEARQKLRNRIAMEKRRKAQNWFNRAAQKWESFRRTVMREAAGTVQETLPDETALAVKAWKSETTAAKEAFSGVLKLPVRSAAAQQKELKPEDITALAERGDKNAVLSFWYFFKFLGLFAGDMALTLKTTGGVYLVGGLLNHPTIVKWLKNSNFRRTFETKGRFSAYLQEVPTFLTTKTELPFMGLVYLAQARLRSDMLAAIKAAPKKEEAPLKKAEPVVKKEEPSPVKEEKTETVKTQKTDKPAKTAKAKQSVEPETTATTEESFDDMVFTEEPLKLVKKALEREMKGMKKKTKSKKK